MKKICISFVLILIIVLLVIVNAKPDVKEEYLRIHVRANSNSQIDQNIKYKVKDVVVEYLTPYIANCKSKQEAFDMLQEQKTAINRVICVFLAKNGFNYGARTNVCAEKFPTRVYDDLTLHEGVYDALIIELGEGAGDNWWCVVYPPLCFTDTKNVKYKSAIYDIIKHFKNK